MSSVSKPFYTEEIFMASVPDKKAIQALYETLKVIRAGSEDDFELRASDDEAVWGVRLGGLRLRR